MISKIIAPKYPSQKVRVMINAFEIISVVEYYFYKVFSRMSFKVSKNVNSFTKEIPFFTKFRKVKLQVDLILVLLLREIKF